MSQAQTKQQSYFCGSCGELLEKCTCPPGTQPPPPPEESSPHQCASWGCPLGGTHRAGEKWHCGWHHRHPVGQADAISQWANRHHRLIEAQRRLSNLGPVCWDRSRWQKASIPVEPGEDYLAYLNRLTEAVRNSFNAEVLHRQPRHPNQPKEKANELPL